MPPNSRSSPQYGDWSKPMRTYQEAADLVVISPRTLRRGRCGELAIVRIGHCTVHIRREYLDAWIAIKDSSNIGEA